ncbi:hypothetical protein SBA1_1550003 [Candidatus Sulfotelmatobacter kueseliae]|uniref:Uncharacterized protein n=1 Tax=Candidatus Sulfotelmatobacter kueseliae TaxID=2042962 RepID=A0A2U3KA39_9BACT|nr:hypothetical protein SBA1_1550003 [Candidatus Sulfotelmatobacter kueseliae]
MISPADLYFVLLFATGPAPLI